MLAKILGFIWIIVGTIWTAKPAMLKNRLQRKMGRRMRRIVFAFLLVFSFVLIGSAIKAPGILAKIVGIIGMLLAIKVMIMITSKASDKIFEWLSERSLVYFRVWGLFVLATGIMLMFLK